jgi:hypothetical protein
VGGTLTSQDEPPIRDGDVTVNACSYLGDRLFGGDGYPFARLYVADYPSAADPERAIRHLAASWRLSSNDYDLEPFTEAGVMSWFCVTPAQFAPRQDLCIAKASQSPDVLHLIILFVSGKGKTSRDTLITLVKVALEPAS